MNNQRKKLAIFPGSFDPLTNAHLDIIKQARTLYDHIYIVVANNPTKKYMFTEGQRCNMITKTMDLMGWKNVICVVWDNSIAEFAINNIDKWGVVHIIRGLRPDNGAEEVALANIYYEDGKNYFASIFTTFFTILNKDFQYISSTRVRSYITSNALGFVKGIVPEPVYGIINNIINCKSPEDIDPYEHVMD